MPISDGIVSTRKYCFDEKCLDLARYFYPKAPASKLMELAQRLQDEVEADDIELQAEAAGTTPGE